MVGYCKQEESVRETRGLFFIEVKSRKSMILQQRAPNLIYETENPHMAMSSPNDPPPPAVKDAI